MKCLEQLTISERIITSSSTNDLWISYMWSGTGSDLFHPLSSYIVDLSDTEKEKMKSLVKFNFKLNQETKEKKNADNIKMIELSAEMKPNRDRFQTIWFIFFDKYLTKTKRVPPHSESKITVFSFQSLKTAIVVRSYTP